MIDRGILKPGPKDMKLINLKGVEVEVPFHMVKELIEKGFRYASSQPAKQASLDQVEIEIRKPGRVPDPQAPMSRHKLAEDLSEETDNLEVTFE